MKFLWYKLYKNSVEYTALYYSYTWKVYLQNTDKVKDINNGCSKDLLSIRNE